MVFWDTLDASMEGSYVMVPFQVPEGTTRIDIRLCHTQPPSPTAQTPGVQVKNTLDLGLYEPLTDGNELWGVDEFRGWGGSSRLRVFVSPSAATNGFMPGPIPAGTWAAEIGAAAITKPHEGNQSGTVRWTLEVKLSADPAGTRATPTGRGNSPFSTPRSDTPPPSCTRRSCPSRA